MTESTFRIENREDGIIVVMAEDTSTITVQHWYEYSMADMLMYTGPTKVLYDMRKLNTLSMNAVRKAVKLSKHPNMSLAFFAVLTTNKTIHALVSNALAIRIGGQYAFFTDEDKAIAWLHSKAPE